MKARLLNPNDVQSRLRVLDGATGKVTVPTYIKKCLSDAALRTLLQESAVLMEAAEDLAAGRRLVPSRIDRLVQARATIRGVHGMYRG